MVHCLVGKLALCCCVAWSAGATLLAQDGFVLRGEIPGMPGTPDSVKVSLVDAERDEGQILCVTHKPADIASLLSKLFTTFAQ